MLRELNSRFQEQRKRTIETWKIKIGNENIWAKKSNFMITRLWSELAKCYRISKAIEATMIVLPFIDPGQEDIFLSKIGPASANESEITYKSHTTVDRGILRNSRQNRCISCHYLRATLQRKSFFSLYHNWHNTKSMPLQNILQWWDRDRY